jgi:hypothetical protein
MQRASKQTTARHRNPTNFFPFMIKSFAAAETTERTFLLTHFLCFYYYRNVETEMVCFPAPLNICLPLSYGPSAADPPIEDDTLQALREVAESGCYLFSLDEFFGEDWD